MIKKVVARMLQRIFNVALGPELGRLNVSQSAEARALFTLSGIAPSGFGALAKAFSIPRDPRSNIE